METPIRTSQNRVAHAGDVRRLVLAKGLRAFADGFIALLLPVYLLELGFTAFEVGLVAATTLFGSGVLTLLVGMHAWRFPLRTLLLEKGLITEIELKTKMDEIRARFNVPDEMESPLKKAATK